MGKEQQGFRRGRGTADGMFTLKQLVEKERQENMTLGFIDLEQAYNIVPRDMAMKRADGLGVEGRRRRP